MNFSSAILAEVMKIGFKSVGVGKKNPRAHSSSNCLQTSAVTPKLYLFLSIILILQVPTKEKLVH